MKKWGSVFLNFDPSGVVFPQAMALFPGGSSPWRQSFFPAWVLVEAISAIQTLDSLGFLLMQE
jgi:hypothetical protein